MSLRDVAPAWAPPKPLCEMDVDERERASRRAQYGTDCAIHRVRTMKAQAELWPLRPITGTFPYFT